VQHSQLYSSLSICKSRGLLSVCKCMDWDLMASLNLLGGTATTAPLALAIGILMASLHQVEEKLKESIK